ncbi:adenylate/guanylate cyclase domain-containing protein [uncultured Tateyamaria sp.]|uniref:adenylate/guanylate cyclase domain-containing protein n=1 Tax=uncultured Tateyamaria sp. TaxID=455651 RepID=UPI00262A9C66|nr:adenylate/guanylate cyclase domain-containing protein [uncultured Tateyamaria sp.]
MADLFDNIIDWLMQEALDENPLTSIVETFGRRLVEGGVPVARISIGRSILHPTIGLLDVQWEQETGQVSTQTVPRQVVRNSLELFDSPFGELSRGKMDRLFADLRDPDEIARFPLFEQLAARGMTYYAAYSRSFGRTHHLYERISDQFRGASIAFATKRFSGFTQADLEGLERVLPALCVCLRADIDRFVAREILETYLGKISGQQVLDGQVERGDGQMIDCAILYSDLRGSVTLSQTLDSAAYLDTVNAYFDCVATAIDEHGGEVLKFIGDGVLAIFPFDDTKRPRANMCAAALASAQEAFARADHANRARSSDGLPALQFGIGLHVGTVIYGNVGTARRLDFTATGPAVGLASRCEGMTRTLGTPLIATANFAAICPAPSTNLGQHSLRGFGAPMTLASYPLT